MDHHRRAQLAAPGRSSARSRPEQLPEQTAMAALTLLGGSAAHWPLTAHWPALRWINQARACITMIYMYLDLCT